MSGLRVEVAGDGPPLVLLHGWAMHGGVFAPLVARLREAFTLHVVDLPGHGGSRASGVPLELGACARAVADVVPPAPWLGWSLGGLVALQAAHAWPARIPALLMLCASPRFVRGGAAPVDGAAGAEWRHGVSAEIFRDFAAGLRTDYRGTLDRFIALEAFGSDHAREEIRGLRAEVLARGEPDPSVLADGLELLERSDLRALLPALAVPSLWLAGRRDRLVDPRAMEAAAALAPGATFAVVEHAGHAPFLTHADVVARHVRGFLATATRGAGA